MKFSYNLPLVVVARPGQGSPTAGCSSSVDAAGASTQFSSSPDNFLNSLDLCGNQPGVVPTERLRRRAEPQQFNVFDRVEVEDRFRVAGMTILTPTST